MAAASVAAHDLPAGDSLLAGGHPTPRTQGGLGSEPKREATDETPRIEVTIAAPVDAGGGRCGAAADTALARWDDPGLEARSS